MSLPKFEHSMPDSPDVVSALRSNTAFLEREKSVANNSKVFSTTRMFDVAGGVSSVALMQALMHLMAGGLIQQLVRVEPKYGEGIADFTSIEEVPDEMEDWRNGARVRVLSPKTVLGLRKLYNVRFKNS